MKSMFKKVQIVLIVAFFALQTNAFAFQHTGSGQYYLSRYSAKRYVVQYSKSRKILSKKIQGKIQSRNSLSKTAYSTKTQKIAAAVTLPANTEGSSNWAGYIDTPASNSSYTSVSGSWKIPDISAGQLNAVTAQWIGLGGVSSSDLLQMGTMEQKENGQTVAEVFWEQLPDPSQNIMTVPVGSTIDVSISQSPDSSSTYNLTFTATSPDNSVQTQTVSTTLDPSYAQGIGTSAEWISEDPSDTYGQLLPLANAGTVQYLKAEVNGAPMNASGNKVQPVALVSPYNTVLIAPSALGADGESFLTTAENSAPSHGVRGYIRFNFRHNFRRQFWWGFTWDIY